MAEDDTSYLERKQKRQHQIFLGRCFEHFEPEHHSHKTWSLSLCELSGGGDGFC